MASHNELGRLGENMAKDFLEKKGFTIIDINWRHLLHEVDIVAMHQKMLIFIEVKTRSTLKYGFPDESVGIKKEHMLKEAAEIYIEQKDLYYEIRFDIISILKNEHEEKIYHIIDAF
tara:strand:+ start:1397 stop:1747 length:351 start_codon:yes stop_codon:yes gene_type:complete